MATENLGANENKKQRESAQKPKAADGKTPVKKKKIIIVTGNGGKGGRQGSASGQRGSYSSGSYSSGGSGSYSSGGSRKSRQGNSRRDGQSGGRNRSESSSGRPAQHKIIRPSVKPTQMEVDYHKPTQQQAARQARRAEETAAQKASVQNSAVESARAAQEAVSKQAAAVQAAATQAEPTAKAASNVSGAIAQSPVTEKPAVDAVAKTLAATEEVKRTEPASAAAEQTAPAQGEVASKAAIHVQSEAQQAAAQNAEAQSKAAAAAQSTQTAGQSRSGAADGARAQTRESGQGTARQERQRSGGQRDGRSFERQTQNRDRSGQSGNGRQTRDGNGQGGSYRQTREGGTQSGSRQGRSASGQSGSRQGSAAGRSGFRQNQGGFGNRGNVRPGQSTRGTGSQGSSRQSSFGNRTGQSGRPGFGDNRRRNAGRPAEGSSFVRDAEKHRDDNKRKMNQERDKRSRKDLIYSEDENKRRNRPGRFIRPEKKEAVPVEEQIKTITIPEKLTIRELAEAMHMNPSEIIKKLFLAGQVMTPNSEVDYEEAEKIALEYDILCEKEQKVDVIEELLKEDEDAEEDLMPRPPVICVMGHVDHGKTSLLDRIRKTNVTDKEAGGITQAIGAYTVSIDGKSITFLDTPGHEAFTAMRMRGANSTDIAVLVVAADDGVMPQTIEAINHAKAAGVEIIVAVNKIDKPGANVDRVKQELTEYELVPTDWGGSTEFVPVSAKTGEGINDLLETILLTADIMELKANPNRKARGLVLEARLDKGRGPVANVLIQKGTLHIGDFISAGASSGKVRAMIDDKGRRVKEAKPSQPVEILGLSDVPSAGEVIVAHETNDEAKAYAATYKNQHKEELIEETRMRMNLDDLFNQMKEGNLKEFNLIIKADVQGSVEALKQSLLKLSNEEVVVKVIHAGVGAITESDVTLASASNAVIMGFNVRPDATAKAMAEHEGVDIRLYKVIYQAIDAVEAALKGMLAPVYEEQVIGHIEVRQLFKASAVGNIAGSYVLDGVVRRGCKCRISRGGEQIFEGNLASLKRFKDDVKEVKAGFECGLVFEGFDKMQVGDIVEAYDLVEVPRT